MVAFPKSNYDLTDSLFQDERYFIETLLDIRSESGGMVPFLFNNVQELYWENRTKRDLILKARRQGFSSLKLGQALARVCTREGYVALIVTHEGESANGLFEHLKIMFHSIPNELRPKVGLNNRTELTFPELNSRVSITTAGKNITEAQSLGRSGVVHFLHCSEYAYWPLPTDSWAALEPCVPMLTGEISIETTANGYNDFFARWREAATGLGGYKPHFFPWYGDSKCSLPLLKGEKERLLDPESPDYLTREEKALIKKYNLTLEQIKWRRVKRAAMSTSRAKFPQEFPVDDVEAFLHSGRPFFDVRRIQARLDSTEKKQPLKHWSNGTAIPLGWRVYTLPVPGRSYVGGGDTAEGISGGDYDAGAILDKETGEEVAVIHSRFGPRMFARQIAHSIHIYGDVLWGIERNNHGHAVLLALMEAEHVPQRYIYHYTSYDEIARKNETRPGWSTDGKSRPIMLDDLADAILNGYVTIHDVIQLRECLTFVEKPSGKVEAQSGSNDDLVLALAIAWQLRKKKPFKQVGW